ncbi:hypothetical protein ACFW42_15065 [Streptomyces albidoflavus]
MALSPARWTADGDEQAREAGEDRGVHDPQSGHAQSRDSPLAANALGPLAADALVEAAAAAG